MRFTGLLTVGIALLVLLLSGCRDKHMPPEDVLKENFREEFREQAQLDKIKLTETLVRGNLRTYLAVGKFLPENDYYQQVSSLGNDYTILEKTWKKGKAVTFSATITSIGSADTGWVVNFFDIQTAPEFKGKIIGSIDEHEGYIVIGSSQFKEKMAEAKRSYQQKKQTIENLTIQLQQVDNDIIGAEKKLDELWGKDENGNQQNRISFTENTDKKLRRDLKDYAEKNSTSAFEKKYNQEVYQPAVEARKRAGGNIYDHELANKRAKVFYEYSEKYRAEYNKMQADVEKMKQEKYKAFYQLDAAKNKLVYKRQTINENLFRLKPQLERWEQDMEQLRQKKIIN
ncbi:DUF1202 family protein [Serratia microhaemolytica]|uniref:DUF1202 family protein n=1 Tax=Serratia microhaemolytica TaxID=2675110 RepID=UPI001F0C75C4|nr:DUF1202 family protein [Serratia microhaemolytica]